MLKLLAFALLCLAANSTASAQQFAFPAAASEDEEALAKAVPALAGQVIAAYEDSRRDLDLNNLFRLQMVAGRHAEAIGTIRRLRESQAPGIPVQAAATFVQYEMVAIAKARQGAGDLSFAEAFKLAFREVYGRLEDRTTLTVLLSFGGANLGRMHDDLRAAMTEQKGKSEITLADALNLLRKYHVHQSYRDFLPLSGDLVAEDDARRYLIQEDIPVTTRDGATVAVMVVQSRAVTNPLPTLLEFTIYANRDWSLTEAKRTAANGYVGVVAYTRGKGSSPDAPVPYEHDGDDAADVIAWISKQSWSDQRVGMYGGSYNSFAQWAAAKRMPPALKALMPSAAVAPGIDVPMEGNIFQSFVYPWPLYTTTGKLLDQERYDDKARWTGLHRKWYTTGQPYRALDQIDGTPNPFFRRWLDHPSYDEYWRQMIPYKQEFAKIKIPVLTTDGYYDGGLIGSLYYFTEHYKYSPHADHYLVIGPYDHLGSQFGSVDVLQGYAIDPVARIDFRELRYQWFDYVFKGGSKPGLLKDKVNYEVLGGNEWKHAPSLDAMGNGSIRFYLTAGNQDAACRLSERRPARDAFIEQEIDFADRSDVVGRFPG